MENFANSSPRSLDRVRHPSNRDFALVRADIRDRDGRTGAFTGFRPDAVIHFAGLKAMGEGEAKSVAFFDTNITGTLSLLEAMEASGCPAIPFSSSVSVCGVPERPPMDEDHPCRPASVYGRNKLMAEQILADWCWARPGASSVLPRCFNPVGAHASGRIGEDPQGMPNNLIPYIAQVAVGRGDHLSMSGDDYDTHDGTAVCDYIQVVDLARAHVAALDNAVAHPGTEVFNIGNGTGHSVREILAAFTRACGRDLPCRVMDRRPGDIAALLPDPVKAGRMPGWTARHGLDDMCQSAWEWQSQNPEGYAPDRKTGA